MLDSDEMQKLKAACLKLPKTSVQEKEEYVTHDPILILMSTVLSLNRRWYKQALPARKHFETEVYRLVTPKTLLGFRDFIVHSQSHRDDWETVALALWGNKERNKARVLANLANYFIDWHKNMPAVGEIDAMREWTRSTSKGDFVGKIKGLRFRAYEQLLWYLDEKQQAIKFDRQVARFVSQAVNRTVPDEEAIQALRQIANEMGISATGLDARIWDYMQAHCST